MKVKGLFLILLSIFSLESSILATEPRKWITASQEDFLEGKLRGISVTGDGKLIIAPAFEPLLDTKEPFVYSIVADPQGNIYLGTGNDGKIYRIDSKGTSQEWAKLGDPGVYALTLDSSGRVFAGTAPEGKVYRLDSTGKAQVFFDPDEKYIWSLTIDAEDNIYVGTGSRGILYKVDPDGVARKFYNSTATHIVSLTWDLDGNILAGTAARALILRLSPEGSPFVIYNSPLEEIKSISVDRYGNIFAAALAGNPETISQQTDSVTKNDSKTISSEKSPGQSSHTVQVSGSSKGRRLEIYRVDRESRVETLYSSDNELAYDLLVRSDGNLLIATGDKGRILSVSPKRSITLLVESGEEQVTRILEYQGKLFATTSNLGKAFELKPRPSEKGVYKSKVFDAGMVASWGTIRWQTNNAVEPAVKASTRTGNTDTPDETWSKWSSLYGNSAGSQIESPSTRYIQWKLNFPAKARSSAVVSNTNAVDLVNISYIQRNMPPLLSSITAHPAGIAFIPSMKSNPPGGVVPGGPNEAHRRSLPSEIRTLGTSSVKPPPRRVYFPGAQSLSWTAQDPNSDQLVYRLDYRGVADEKWMLLEKNLTGTQHTFDGKSFPDGSYLVRVTVSDSPSNPEEQAMESELVSKPFTLANSSPIIKLRTPRIKSAEAQIEMEIRTLASVVHQVEYSLDGGDWKILFPEDGIADSTVENYVFTLKSLRKGMHLVTVRVVDSVGNLGTGQLKLTLP